MAETINPPLLVRGKTIAAIVGDATTNHGLSEEDACNIVALCDLVRRMHENTSDQFEKIQGLRADIATMREEAEKVAQDALEFLRSDDAEVKRLRETLRQTKEMILSGMGEVIQFRAWKVNRPWDESDVERLKRENPDGG